MSKLGTESVMLSQQVISRIEALQQDLLWFEDIIGDLIGRDSDKSFSNALK